MQQKDVKDIQDQQAFLKFLMNFISENKKSKIGEIIRYRTRHITIVLEDIFQPHNASAVLRSCDCFGVQDVHIIENKNAYQVNPDVALGSSKWLTLYKYNGKENNTPDCITYLKGKGYKIVATTPHENDYSPDTLPLDQKIALVFGTELNGLSDYAISASDAFIRIPMVGFTESLNISVSAAILLHALTERLRAKSTSWHLTEEDKLEISLQWAKNVVKKSNLLEKEFFKNLKNV